MTISPGTSGFESGDPNTKDIPCLKTKVFRLRLGHGKYPG